MACLAVPNIRSSPLVDKETRSGEDVETNSNNPANSIKRWRNKKEAVTINSFGVLALVSGRHRTLINMSETPFHIFVYALEIWIHFCKIILFPGSLSRKKWLNVILDSLRAEACKLKSMGIERLVTLWSRPALQVNNLGGTFLILI